MTYPASMFRKSGLQKRWAFALPLMHTKIKVYIKNIETDTIAIAGLAQEREAENDRFRQYLKRIDEGQIDAMVHQLNEQVSAQVDCTKCGACCRHLMIEVTGPDAERMANGLQMNTATFKEKYVETGSQGMMLVSQIPCHFLEGNICTQYQHRFTDCREFPHLHKSNFTSRLFGTLMHYSICPIIYNVVEGLKEATDFK